MVFVVCRSLVCRFASGGCPCVVAVRDILRKYKVPAYDEINNKGEVRYLEVRRSKSTGEMMVILVCLQFFGRGNDGMYAFLSRCPCFRLFVVGFQRFIPVTTTESDIAEIRKGAIKNDYIINSLL